MRKRFHILIKEYFCQMIFDYRESQRLTQLQMAERLWMDERSYIDLEHGKNSCSVVTLIVFLLFECPDVNAFLADMNKLFRQASKDTQKRKDPAVPR